MMENNNYHGLPPIKTANKPKRNNSWIYIAIIILLLTTNILLFTNKQETEKQLAQTESQQDATQLENVNLQVQYGAALKKLDEMVGKNAALDKIIKDQDSELAHMKNRIEAIIANKNASAKELSEAKILISKLNSKISDFESQILALKNTNKVLVEEKQKITDELNTVKQEKVEVEKKVEMGKAFTASNILIQPIELRKGGSKEVETSRARRVDILRVKFDLNENRLVENGPQTFYIRIVNPEGKLLTNKALGSGSFDSKETGSSEHYTISKVLTIVPNQSIMNVVVDWEQTAEYIKGAYHIELYNQGYLIGKAITQLK